jgi:hypothetical protein
MDHLAATHTLLNSLTAHERGQPNGLQLVTGEEAGPVQALHFQGGGGHRVLLYLGLEPACQEEEGLLGVEYAIRF